MTEKPLAEQFREGIQAVVEPLKSELRASISDEVAAKLDPVAKELVDVRTQLAELETRGDVRPTDEKVKDLEKRLTDSEEAIRVIRVSPALPINQKKDASEAFKGLFIKDVDKLRSAISNYRNGHGDSETRAISSSLFVTGGRLPAEVDNQFIDFLIEQQVTLPRVVTRRMMSPEAHTDELTIAARKMRKATENTAPALANAFGNKRRTLNTIEVIWAEDISLGFLEDNLERAGAEQHITRMIATQFGNDTNDLAWNGDVADTADPFRSINNGWITLAQDDSDTNNVDISDTAIGVPTELEGTPSAIMHLISMAMPYKFKGRTDLAFTVPIRFAEQYADQLAARQTSLGDQVMIGGFPAMRYFGRQVRPEPHFIEENGDKVVLTGDGNLFFGIQRGITMETEWKPRERRIEVTVTARTDFQYATGTAIVLGSALPATLRG